MEEFYVVKLTGICFFVSCIQEKHTHTLPSNKQGSNQIASQANKQASKHPVKTVVFVSAYFEVARCLACIAALLYVSLLFHFFFIKLRIFRHQLASIIAVVLSMN